MANGSKQRVTTEIPYSAFPYDTRYEKATSYGPAQYNHWRSPAKARSDKLRLGSTDADGYCSSLRPDKAFENCVTKNTVRLRDTSQQ